MSFAAHHADTTLPPLPDFLPEFRPRWPGDPGGYSADQMRAYAIAALAQQAAPAQVSDAAIRSQ